MPLKIVSRGTSSAIPLMTYTFTPTGGVITPISVTRTIITPNHMGSKPRVRTTGYMMGTVRVIRARASIKHPPRRYRMTMIAIIAAGGRGSPPTHSDKTMGILATAMKCPKIIAPVTMTITMQLMRRASLIANRNPCQFSCRLDRPMSKAPKAPAAPACVGLNQPINSPPTTRAKRISISITPTSPAIFFFQLVGAPAGARLGLRRQRMTTTAMKRLARSMPGRTPAINSLPMDCSVIMP